jgi:hypothetical protein
MTEFEIAQLEFMQAERNVNLLELVQTQGIIMQSDSTQFTTLLFGYLLVAYFIGANLTRIQVAILNVLYVASIAATLFQIITALITAQGFLNRFLEVSGNSAETTAINPMYLAYGLTIGLAAVLTSLYFMRSVGHPKTE